jgi:hypothetical protein
MKSWRPPKHLQAAIAERNGMAVEEVSAVVSGPAKRAKYGNRRVQHEGRTFDSIRELKRYLDLAILQAAGEIADLECQPVYELHAVGGQKCGSFRPDFRYCVVKTGEVVVEDVKSRATRTTAYMMRKRWLLAEHGVRIQEIF